MKNKDRGKPLQFTKDALPCLTDDRFYGKKDSINWIFPWVINHVIFNDMVEIKKILNSLISATDNICRSELYKNFYRDISSMTLKTEKDTINKMYANLSGLIAYSELNKKEYDVLRQLLQHLEKIH